MVTVYFDGSIAPINPGGTARAGVRIEFRGEVVKEISEVIGSGAKMSNNVAEYEALNLALEYLIRNGFENEKVEAYGDSQIVINAMNKNNSVSYGLCRQASIKCRELVEKFSDLSLIWIPREQNLEADKLSNPRR